MYRTKGKPQNRDERGASLFITPMGGGRLGRRRGGEWNVCRV